jgi:hypothetical protein
MLCKLIVAIQSDTIVKLSPAETKKFADGQEFGSAGRAGGTSAQFDSISSVNRGDADRGSGHARVLAIYVVTIEAVGQRPVALPP